MIGPNASSETNRQVVRLSGDGVGRLIRLPSHHRWCEVLVQFGAAVTAGDVAAVRLEPAAESGLTILAPLTRIRWTDAGRVAVFQTSPGAALLFTVENFAGAGSVSVAVVSWCRS